MGERSPLAQRLLKTLRDAEQPLDVLAIMRLLRQQTRFAPPESQVRDALDRNTELFYRLPDDTYLLREQWEAQQREAAAQERRGRSEPRRSRSDITPFAPNEYIVFDLETTGRDPGKCHIIQIAALHVRNGSVIDEPFRRLVKPPDPIPHEIVQLTGITNEELQAAPPLQNVLPEFLTFIGNLPLVAHNGRAFDSKVLTRRSKDTLNVEVSNPVVDSLELAVLLDPCQKGYKLKDLGTRFGIPFDESALHNAEADVNLLAQVFQRLVAQLNALPAAVKDYLLFLLPPTEWATANFVEPYPEQGKTNLDDCPHAQLDLLHRQSLPSRQRSDAGVGLDSLADEVQRAADGNEQSGDVLYSE